ncbi:hypothetical protein LKR43_05090 [Pusillimonas sp. MFBS29]|uniref:hypothetical protein n=1 Tax=Pusillimonas sp. MFBS29 TaxID=2886690 RepID=UPI001D10B896|nr:hypothetical protein [Pusillimonas sp. MFBS29]MCC2595709.1 hypothetical protein [Pusillimonas sp. MFBS29]
MSIFQVRTSGAAAVAAILFALSAFSHVSLQTKQAPIESSYKVVFGVPHDRFWAGSRMVA